MSYGVVQFAGSLLLIIKLLLTVSPARARISGCSSVTVGCEPQFCAVVGVGVGVAVGVAVGVVISPAHATFENTAYPVFPTLHCPTASAPYMVGICEQVVVVPRTQLTIGV
jgi:hypothetical protein